MVGSLSFVYNLLINLAFHLSEGDKWSTGLLG